MPRIRVDDVEPDRSPRKERVTVKHVEKVEKATAEKNISSVDLELKEKSGSSTLSAFCVYPSGINFSGAEEDEIIILLLRAHVVTNVPWILAVIGLSLIPLIVFPFLIGLSVFPPVGIGTSVFVTLLWYAGVFTYALVNFLYWFFNVYLVTSERIVDIDWYSLVNQKVSSTGISHIEDVNATRTGVLTSIFDYGSIFIQTAGTEENFEFINVPHPQLVAKKIDSLMQKEEGEFETK